MTPLAAGHLASMLKRVEAGADWPAQLALAKAMFLAKVEHPTSALEFRLLAICSHVYSRWASLRLQQVTPWSEQWIGPPMHAGAPGRSTADASWCFALHVEATKMRGQTSALSIDLFKAFDQVSRPLVFLIARRLGAPHSSSMLGLTCWIS